MGRVVEDDRNGFPRDDDRVGTRAAAIYGEAYAKLPSAKLVPIRNSYHFIVQDQPAAFEAALDAFLK